MVGLAYDEAAMAERLGAESAVIADTTVKGLPPDLATDFAGVGALGLGLLDGDLPLPVAVLKRSALDANRSWMRRFLAQSGARIAPHGKTPMSPELARMQMEDGAWGITAATAQQAAIFAGFGIRRIIIANQLVGKRNIAIVLDLLASHPDLDLYCLVDSSDGARLLADSVASRGAGGRSLQVLIEVGAAGARTGLREESEALTLARTIASLAPHVLLRGVEAYEGVFGAHPPAQREALARALIGRVATLASRCAAEGLFAEGPVVLTAGGTEFFDIAASGLFDALPGKAANVVIRSGCYLTHDHLSFERMFQQMLGRSPHLESISPPLVPALEVWAAVQSQPEPGLAFCTMGKRDVSYDVEMPVPVHWFRPGEHARVQSAPPGLSVSRLNDQHAFLRTPDPSPLRVGDLIGFGVSHVCTTFDKWRCVLIVDDDYLVVQAVRTYF